MRPRKISLLAGVAQETIVSGDYVRCESSSADFLVQPDDGSDPTLLNAGESIETDTRFTRLTFVSDTTQVVTVEAGFYRKGSNRLSGDVTVANTIAQVAASKTQSLTMGVYAGSRYTSEDLAFVNDGVESLYITNLILKFEGAGQAIRNLFIDDVLIAGSSLADDGLYDKSDQFAARVGSFRGASPIVLSLNNELLHAFIFEGEYDLFSEQAPFELKAGHSLGLVHGVGDVCQMIIEAQTAVPQSFSSAAAQNVLALTFGLNGQLITFGIDLDKVVFA